MASRMTAEQMFPFDPSEECVTVQVVEALSEATSDSSLDLPPLGEVVDTDALESLFTGDTPGLVVSFEVEEYEVTINRAGTIVVSG